MHFYCRSITQEITFTITTACYQCTCTPKLFADGPSRRCFDLWQGIFSAVTFAYFLSALVFTFQHYFHRRNADYDHNG